MRGREREPAWTGEERGMPARCARSRWGRGEGEQRLGEEKRKARCRARRSELGAETRKWVRAWGLGLGPPSPSQSGSQRPAARAEEERAPQRSHSALQQRQVTRPPPPRGAGLGRGPGRALAGVSPASPDPSSSGPCCSLAVHDLGRSLTAGGASVSSSVTHGALPLPPRGCCERGDAVPVRAVRWVR